MRYLIREGEPFPGYVVSTLDRDNKVGFTNGMSLEAYEAANGPMIVISETELRRLIARHAASMRKAPQIIDAERYHEMLNVLPPCRWRTIRGIEMFHVSERIQHDLVSWFGKAGDIHMEAVDHEGADMEMLAQSFAACAFDSMLGPEPSEMAQ